MHLSQANTQPCMARVLESPPIQRKKKLPVNLSGGCAENPWGNISPYSLVSQ